MSKDQAIGALILVGSIVGIVVYAWLIYAYAIVVLQITAFLAVAAMLAILAWIGWTMATTPPPAPLEPEPATTSQTSDSANLEQQPWNVDSKRRHTSASSTNARTCHVGSWSPI